MHQVRLYQIDIDIRNVARTMIDSRRADVVESHRRKGNYVAIVVKILDRGNAKRRVKVILVTT